MTFYFSDVDIVLTKGFRKSRVPNIEVHRKERISTLMCRGEEYDTALIAVASNEELNVDAPLFDINDFSGICDFIVEFFFIRLPYAANKDP